MRVVIVGGGRMGRVLASRLIEIGDEPIIVELDEERAHELAKRLDLTVVHDDGTDPNVLKKARIEKANALVAVTSSDDVNLMICKLGDNFKVPRVITRVNEEEHTKMFEDVGADVTINSILATVGLFEKAIKGPELYGLLSLGGYKADAIEVTVGSNSEVVGKTIQELNIQKLCTVAMITRSGELIPPRGDTEFLENDQVILVGESDAVNSLSKIFRGSNSKRSLNE